MPSFGAHMSIAGGIYKAVEAAAACGMDCVQVFTKNNNQWNAKPLTQAEVDKFQTALEDLKIGQPIAHDSYLINLAAPDDVLWEKSIAAMIVELRRAEQLKIPYVVAHPGAFTTSSELDGLARIVAALDRIHRDTPGLQSACLLETTAGQGSNLGWRFEHLAAILDEVEHPERLGVCVDTCHIFAAGYPISSPADYRATFAEFDRLIGLERIRAFHLNDSVKGLGSRVDRHAHIGLGQIGDEAFRLLVRDERFEQVPMYLETPKGVEDGEAWDVKNLRRLKSFLN